MTEDIFWSTCYTHVVIMKVIRCSSVAECDKGHMHFRGHVAAQIQLHIRTITLMDLCNN